MTELRDEEDRREFAMVKTQVTRLEGAVETLSAGMRDIKGLLEQFRNPRPTNWVGICSFGLALTIGVGSFVGMWLQLRLTPIEKDVSALNNDFKGHSARVQRDLEWLSSNSADRNAFFEKNLDRVWDRVFSGDLPKFSEKPKP